MVGWPHPIYHVTWPWHKSLEMFSEVVTPSTTRSSEKGETGSRLVYSCIMSNLNPTQSIRGWYVVHWQNLPSLLSGTLVHANHHGTSMEAATQVPVERLVQMEWRVQVERKVPVGRKVPVEWKVPVERKVSPERKIRMVWLQQSQPCCKHLCVCVLCQVRIMKEGMHIVFLCVHEEYDFCGSFSSFVKNTRKVRN